jgi:hypothetical protein
MLNKITHSLSKNIPFWLSLMDWASVAESLAVTEESASIAVVANFVVESDFSPS